MFKLFFPSKVSVDVCTAPSVLNVRWADSHLATRKKWQLSSPTARPHGTEEREREQKMSPRFEDFRGQKKNIFNEALRCFSKHSDSAARCLLE